MSQVSNKKIGKIYFRLWDMRVHEFKYFFLNISVSGKDRHLNLSGMIDLTCRQI